MQLDNQPDAAAVRIFPPDMSSAKASRFLSLLCVLGMLTSTTGAAQTPAETATRQYAFELRTLNLGDTVRTGPAGGRVTFNVENGMTEDELESVKNVLDQLGASQVDDEGYRDFSMPNGTRVRIGGFLVEGFLEDSVEGVQSLPVEFSVKNEFSTAEASLVLRIATAGHLFVGSSDDSERVATRAQVADRRFAKRHKQASITPDENALAEWVRQNIPPRTLR